MTMSRGLRVLVVALAAAALAGCGLQYPRGERGPSVARPAAAPTTAPTGLSAADLTARLLDGPATAREFYMGDHLGMNLDLTLMAGGGYALKWHGCQGLYGSAVGRWRVDGDRVLLDAIDQQGRLAEQPIRALHVRLFTESSRSPADVALVPDFALADFATDGARDESCFRPMSMVMFEMFASEAAQ